MDIKELIDRIIADGKLTVKEHKLIKHAVNLDRKMDEVESEQIGRVLDMIRSGKLKVV